MRIKTKSAMGQHRTREFSHVFEGIKERKKKAQRN
jgi:hypothetical protein